MPEQTYIRTSEITAGTSVLTIVKNNPDRVALSIINNSENTIYLHTKNDLVVSRGFRLPPNSTFSVEKTFDYALTSVELFVLSTAADTNLTVYETIKTVQYAQESD